MQRFPRAIPAVLFLLVIGSTLIAVVALEQADRSARRLELERGATEIAAALNRRALESIVSLNAAAALMSAGTPTASAPFARFVAALPRQNSGRGPRIGWAPLLRPDEVPAYEAAQRGRAPGYAVFPAPPRETDRVVPVTYLEPASTANRPALGFDMYSETLRRSAVDPPGLTRRAAGSGKLTLIGDEANCGGAGFIVYLPVYDEAGRVLRGFVYSPLRAADFIAATKQLPLARDLAVAVYDTSDAPANLLAGAAQPAAAGDRLLRRLTIAERPWMLAVTDRPRAGLALLSQLTLLFGAALALLVLALARAVARQAVEDGETLERVSSEAAIRTSLTRELNHRVKNTLANVLSIVSLTRRRAASLDDFADSLAGRIRALSATHDLLSQNDWSSASIDRIVRSELAPYMAGEDTAVIITGPAIALAPSDALSLGLAIHELATNAAKYGALSASGGQVLVSWRLMSSALAEVQWRETGGPAVAAPAKRGFGRDLIEKIVASELKNTVDLEFAPGGVRCRLRVPVRRTGDFTIRRG